MYDLVTIGDATMDVFINVEDAEVNCDLDRENCQLCFNYADKIEAKGVDFIIGGNAINGAVGARRLGKTSAFLSSIGEDDTGRKISEVLEREGVSTEYLTVVPNQPSNYSVVINFQGERTILVYHVPRSYRWKVESPPPWFYMTSMGEGFDKIYGEVIKLAQTHRSKVAYNPGTIQLKGGLEWLRPSLAASEILFLNREESTQLLGLGNNPSIKELLATLKKLGPKIVVVTDGREGSYCFDGDHLYQMGIYDGPMVERTGAGDAYGIAFTVAVIEGKSSPEAMTWGSANSTSVVAQTGPQAGLLTTQGIKAMIEKNGHIVPIEL